MECEEVEGKGSARGSRGVKCKESRGRGIRPRMGDWDGVREREERRETMCNTRATFEKRVERNKSV